MIGVGYLGRFHAQKYAAASNAELLGVADTNTDQCQMVAGECHCACYSDYKKLLKDVDAVSIAVPTSAHHQVARECLLAGKDILLEKPMTVTLEEADELLQIAKERSLIIQVGHLERFNPAVMALAPFLTQPLFIESQRIAPFKSRGADVDVVLDLMIHDIDIILNIVNSPLSQIHTVGAPVVTNTSDIANARLIFENGTTANITVSRISGSTVRKMRIFQLGSYVDVDFGKRKIMTVQLSDDRLESGMRKKETSVYAYTEGDALKNEVDHFLDCIIHRKQPLVAGLEGRRALDVALQVIGQIQENQKSEVFKGYFSQS